MNPPPSNGPVPARLRIFAVVLVLASVAMGYFFLYQPVVEAGHTGRLIYSTRALLLSPALLYSGIVMLFADLRDGQIKQIGADGNKRLTGKGWAFAVGLIAVMGLAVAGWYLLLQHLGFRVE